jgi:hypothetical protein
MEYLDNMINKNSFEEVEIDGKKFDLKKDVEKFFISNNKTAGVRVRKVMQEIKNYHKK